MIKILKIRSTNPYFISNEIFNSKLANIILKICLKLVQSKNFGSTLNIIRNLFDKDLDNMIVFNDFVSNKYELLFKKIYLLTQIDNNNLEEEKIDSLIMKMEKEDDSINNSENNNDFLLFSFIIYIRRYNKGFINNEEIVSKLKILLTLDLSFDDFSIAYAETNKLEGKVYLMNEYLKSDKKNWNNEKIEPIFSLIISLIKEIMKKFIGAENKSNSKRNASIGVKAIDHEDEPMNCIKLLEEMNIFDDIINLIEIFQLTPKIILSFLQTVMRFSLLLTYSLKNFSFSSKVLEALIEIQRKTTAKNNKSLLKETYYLQMNNLLMLGRIEMAQEIYYITQNMEKDKSIYNFYLEFYFFLILIRLKLF